jgi:hypothetical protein
MVRDAMHLGPAYLDSGNSLTLSESLMWKRMDKLMVSKRSP